MAQSAAVFVKKAFTAGVPQRFLATVTGTLTAGLQWVLDSGAGNTTIVFYASVLRAGHELLADEDPTTNKLWSLTPIVFDHLPGGGRNSDILPLGDIGVATLLLQITSDAPMTLSLYSYQLGDC